MPARLTDKQIEVLAYIRSHLEEFGYPPSRLEISTYMEVAPNAAQGHIRALQRKGYIEVAPGISRGIRVIEADERRVKV